MEGLPVELSLEIDRVVACPYPASLARLADILSRADCPTVRASIRDRPPCTIAKLAFSVAAALPLWQYSIDILQSLSVSPVFREKILIDNPGLLEALLTKTNSSQQAFDEYSQLCVTLLSQTLPESVPLPASAQTFFLRVFERTVPSDGTPFERVPHADAGALRSVYCMLNGACKGLLTLLPARAKCDFDDKLKRILSSSTTGQDSMLLLWCFGIAILAEHPDVVCDGSSTRLPAIPASLQWKTKSGEKLFGSNVDKTIGLAYLSVIWAVKGDVGVSDAEALEGIRVATRTLRLIDQQVRERWPRSTSLAKNMFPKLPSKIKRKDLSADVRLEALAFYALVAGTDGLHADTIQDYETALTNLSNVEDLGFLKETLSTSLALFAPQIRQPAVCAVLCTLLELHKKTASVHELTIAKILADELAAVIPHCPEFRYNVLTVLSSSTMEESIYSLGRLEDSEHDESQRFSCPSYIKKKHHDLLLATISMLLTSAFAYGSTKPSLPSWIGIALLDKQRHLPVVASHCNHPDTLTNLYTVSLFQQESTPISGDHLQDWQGRLKTELENQSFYQRDSIIRSVTQICHDLESRCETAEAPLRVEQDKSRRLETEVLELRKTVASMEEKSWENNEHLTALDAENERVEQEKAQLSVQLEHLRQELDNTNAYSNEALVKAQESHNNMEVQLRSAFLAQEEDARAYEKELEGLREKEATFLQRAELAEGRCEALNSTHAVLHAKCNNKEDELASERRTVSDQAEELSRLNDEGNKLRHSLQDTETELATVALRLSDLEVRHHELAQSSNEALEKLEHEHEINMRATASKAAEEYSQMHVELQAALRDNSEVNKAHEEAQRDLQRVQSTLPPLQTKIEELTSICLEKEDAIGELTAWRNRVLGSMSEAPVARSALRSSSEINDPQTPRQHRQRKSSFQAQNTNRSGPTATQGISGTAMEDVANASFTSSDSQHGPTPKRAKPRSSSKAPAMHTSYSNRPVLMPISSSKRLSPTKRAALKPISPNRRHTIVGFSVLQNEKIHESKPSLPMRNRSEGLHDAEQPEFDMESYLTGTPFTPGNFIEGTGRAPTDDGDTTEL